jgi:hypothetical protein
MLLQSRLVSGSDEGMMEEQAEAVRWCLSSSLSELSFIRPALEVTATHPELASTP